jgi:hypothetical protein
MTSREGAAVGEGVNALAGRVYTVCNDVDERTCKASGLCVETTTNSEVAEIE